MHVRTYVPIKFKGTFNELVNFGDRIEVRSSNILSDLEEPLAAISNMKIRQIEPF